MFFNPPNYTSYEVIIIIIIHVTSRCSTSNYSYCLTPDEKESSVYEYVPGIAKMWECAWASTFLPLAYLKILVNIWKAVTRLLLQREREWANIVGN